MKVLGYFRGTTKQTKKDYTVIHVSKEFEDYQRENAVGFATESIYVPNRIDLNIGDEIELEYDKGFGGQAIVKNVKILER